MVEQQYILLRGREIDNIEDLDVYVDNGGYEGLKKSLKLMLLPKPQMVTKQ